MTAGIDTDTPDFDYQDMNETNLTYLRPADLVPIVSEYDGGIIAYAVDRDHAEAMVRALNGSWASLEYRQATREIERRDYSVPA